MELAVFVLFAVLSVAFSLVVVVHRDPVKSTMSMVVTLFCLAVLFVLLGAPFIAALQVLLYAGAILVLFLFVLMLLNLRIEVRTPSGRVVQRWTALVTAAFFAGMVGMLLWRTYSGVQVPEVGEEYTSIKGLAALLFTRYLLPFELIGLLLLVAVVAASLLARKPPAEDADGGPA
jgi:NADH-quinone oxidoreductase subunit J